MDEHSLFLFLFGIFVFCLWTVEKATATCTLPSPLANSEWRDSRSGLVTFTDTQAAGWSFTISVQAGSSPQTRDQWICHVYNETDGYLVMKTTETFIQFVVNVYTAYRCMKMSQVTDNSYRYYIINPKQSSLGDERLHISESDSETNWNVLCNTEYGASGAEFIVLVRADNIAAAKIELPYLFLADYEFTLTSTSTCDVSTVTSTIEMCADNYALAITGSSCAASLFFTNAAALWCVDVLTEGSTTFIVLYNGLQDNVTVDGTNTFFFTCIAVNSDHNVASVVPANCRENQTSSTLPADTNVGSTLSLTAVSAPCPPCPTLTAPTEGNVTKITDGAVTTATYTCNAGFTLSGDATRVCQTNGTWSGTGASCTCAFPSAPVNGSVSLGADGLSVIYTCDSGTVLVGTSNRTCNTDLNTWTGSAPTCDTCESLISPTDGSYVISSTGLTSQVTFSCDPGTTLVGVQTSTCQTDTTWSQSPPSCVSCPNLSSPGSGNVTITTDGITSTAVYACAQGYFMVGSNVSTCSSTGTWNNSPPSCDCESPSTPTNGTVTLSGDGMTSEYTCDLWFTLNGTSQRTCQSDGTGWSGNEPVCVECTNSLSTPTNGTLDVTTNGTVTIATFSCHVGTSLSGNVNLNCGVSGSWSTTEPVCATCQSLQTLTSGNVTLVSDGVTTSAEYTCDVGSTISGSSTVTCNGDGTWSIIGDSPTCVTCPNLSLTGGNTVLTSDGTTSTATLTCTDGYVIQGSSTSECQSNGTWSVTDTECVAAATAASSTDSEMNLLPAVIVLAILAVLFAVAFSVAVFYIFKNRQRQKWQSGWTNLDQGFPDADIDSTPSAAPMDHKRHVLDLNKMVSSKAPASHAPTPSGLPGNRSLRSASSNLSFGSPRLEWAKEATVSSIFMTPSEPAPWSRTKQDNKQRPLPNELALDLSNLTSRSETGDDTITRKLSHTPRRKKIIVSKPKADQNMNTLSSTSIISTGLSNNPLMPSKRVSRKGSGDREPSKVSRMNTRTEGSRRVREERATTPVKHVLAVRDPDDKRTPRSNRIATVQ